ncbi:MerR family transcriptional regulator [Clostridium botulinum C/D str. BKT12695]|nr:MerR family transcriptional regulator [Clostridium botulinum C/D str. BKT12695]
MRTVKQVSDLTGISVRSLHYYDEIGLLKPSEITEAGYRLYDEEDIKILQQILFFKEIVIPLKEVKKIMFSPCFDKMEALKNQKKLLILKRKRLNGLIELINKTLKGESTMSFKEFDMSEYFNVLEEFKTQNEDKIIKLYGSVDKYNELIEGIKSKEGKIAKMAIKKYGSIQKYAKAVKKNFNSGMLNLAEQYDKFKKDLLDDNNPKLKELYKKLVSDLNKDPSSNEIQQIAGEITNTTKKDYEIFNMKKGDDHWYYMVQIFFVYSDWMKEVDKKYGSGASKFIGEALKIYLGNKQPKLEMLYNKLVSDLCKDPSSNEIQQIVEEISDATKESNEFYKIDAGENHWEYMSQLYLTNSNFIKVIDKKYGSGASKFIGESFKFYAKGSKS